MEEQKVYSEVPSANLERIFGADEAEIATEFGDKPAEIAQDARV